MRKMNKRNQSGFTLVEVLIVAVIVTILMSIALPLYQENTRQTRRSEGQSLLLEAAQIQERHFTEFGQYALAFQDTGNPDADTATLNQTSPNGYYTLSITSPTTTSFTLEATPGGGHTDPDCGTLTLTHTAIKGPTDTCWGK